MRELRNTVSSERVYKPAFSHEKAVEIIKSEQEKQFDPKVVETFLLRESEFKVISETLAD